MKKKVFSLMMTLVLAFMGMAQAQVSLPYQYGFETTLASEGWSSVYTANTPGTTTTFANSGTYSFRFSSYDHASSYDQYLISPELDAPEGVIVQFYYRAHNYGTETFKVGYSTTDNQTSSFTFGDEVSTDVRTWTQSEEYTFPAGTKYVAIYYYSNYAYYLYVDDFTFAAPGGGGGGGGGTTDQLHVKYMDGDEEVIDELNLGTRPAGSWMAPFEFTMFTDGALYVVNALDFTPSDGMFTVAGEELPFQVTSTQDVALNITTNGTEAGLIERQFVALTEGDRAAHIWPVTVTLYTPEIPDVWEKAYDFGTVANGFSYTGVPSQITPTVLHNDYTLPFPEIPEGVDAVYKFKVNSDMIVSAHVDENATDGKVALYKDDFDGEGGPMATNYYPGLNGGDNGGASGGSYQAMIGDETSTATTNTVPMCNYYNFSLSNQLYLATELVAAGATTAPMRSVSWYSESTYGYEIMNVSIWMANVTDTEANSTSPLASGMTLVYQGNFQEVVGWNEFVFNAGSFAWDGHSNVLVMTQMNNGDWDSAIMWMCHNAGFYASSYARNDSSGAYNASTTTYSMTRATTRANTLFKSNGRTDTPDPNIPNSSSNNEVSCGPVINNLGLTPGTYYLVASANQPDYTVYINVDDMPCPTVNAEGFALNPQPADDEDDVDPVGVTLRWMIPEYATAWRLVFGSTYYPEAGHPQTIVTDWSENMVNSYTLPVALWNNTNYFWHVEFKNDGCPAGVSSPIWGFTTHLHVPQFLTVDDASVFNDETVTLSWRPVIDRTYRIYNIYRDGVKIGETDVNDPNDTSFTDGPLAYNMAGYTYTVTAVYDEGESAHSNEVVVKVSGYGNVSGHVYERYPVNDQMVGIAGATVTMVGQDEFGDSHTYHFTTDGTGAYIGQTYVGSYVGSAACTGYQSVDAPVQGNPIPVVYNQTASPYDYILDENFYTPCTVVAQYYPDSLDVNSPYVKVYWGCGLPGEQLIEDFETGDLSAFPWNTNGSYPWEVTTTHPYEGAYCMRSTNYNVASSTSSIDVTVDIPENCMMSFYAYISSETTYDKGLFYIDGAQRGNYSGAGNTWSQKTFEITEGTHTFKWEYSKDGSVNSNEDRFYIDYITFYQRPDDALMSTPQASTEDRAFSHYRVYRTNCYNDGPYTEENTVILACELLDTLYIDVSWPDAEPGVYKWGVGCVYNGNRGEEIESQINWSEPVAITPEKANRDEMFDFEDGVIPAGWTNDATYPWTVVTTAPQPGFHGTYCIMSGNSGVASSTSSISTTVNYTENGTVSFLAGIWGEGSTDTYDWDKCRFYIDDAIVMDYGAHAAWENASYNVTAGSHTFTWTYKKDGSVNPTGDAFFIDDVAFTIGNGGGSGSGGSTGPGTEPVQEPRESVIVWSNCLDKDMYLDHVSVNVVLNSADNPEGTVVSFTNLNEFEQQEYPQASITLDSTGYYLFDHFRRGDYIVKVEHLGYQSIEVQESIREARDLRYVLIELLFPIENLYVSRTGWAMWDEPDLSATAPSGGNSIIDFETGDFSQYDFDNAVSSYPWAVVANGNDGGYCMKSTNSGVASSSSAIQATKNYASDGMITFDALCQGEGTSTHWDKCLFYIDGNEMMNHGAEVSGWNEYSYPVTAGEHTFRWEYTKDGSVNPTGDCLMVDNISFSIGRETRNGETRHLEGYKVMCTSIDGEPIFNHNTIYPNPFCQLTTVDPYSGQLTLIEGEHYIAKVCAVYSTGQSDWVEAEWQYEPCDHWGPVDEVTVNTTGQGNNIEWVFENGFNPYGGDTPGPGPGPGTNTFSYNFDNVSGGNIADWTTFQGSNGDSPNGWMTYDQHNYAYTNMGHNGSAGWVYSESYITGANVAVHPDNYLVSPLTAITSSSVLNFWVTDANDSYGAEHFTVEVSTTSNNSASAFTPVFEHTLLSKGARNGRDLVNDQVWYNFSVNLSAYAGQQVYIAFHHFNCYDQWFLALDDVELTTGAKGYSAMESGMLGNGTYAFNITDIANFDERVFFLYNLSKDVRFDVVNGEAPGMFIVSATTSDLDLESAVRDFIYNNHIEFDRMDKVQAADVANAYKSYMPAGFVNSLMMDMYIQSRENNTCAGADPFCTDNGMYEFPAGVDAGSGESGPDYDCLYTQPNPAWYYMRIGNPGAMDIYMYSTPQVDIDFCCWGPFDDPSTPCPYGLTENKVVSCSYSTAANEHCMIPASAQTGEYYILVITNYSNDPCNINFSAVGGAGSTDCGILPPVDIIGFLITEDGEYLGFAGPTEREFLHEGEFGNHEYCVRPIYPGEMTLPENNFGWSMGCPVCSTPDGTMTCDAYMPIHGEALNATDQVKIWWGEENPGPGPGPSEPFFDDFENGLGNWTLIDADGDGENWYEYDPSEGLSINAHSGSMVASSWSWRSVTIEPGPDQYMISPMVEGATSIEYFVNTNASFPDHYAIMASSTGNNASDFSVVFEEDAPGAKDGEFVSANNVTRGGYRGAWVARSVDLPAGTKYVAFRHFNSYDMNYLLIDDVTINTGAKSRANVESFKVYRSTDNVDYAFIGSVNYVDGQTYYEYIDTPAAAGTYYYHVTTVYSNDCESAPAVDAENPTNNYVMVGVTGIDENSDKVALYPNPTKGNVTIEANGMSRITVVSMLGQVVFDTEVNADVYTLNMAQFNAGMYMVRVYTEEGVTVKRVTVMQ